MGGGVCTRPSLWEGGAYTGLFQQEKEHVQSSSVKWRSVYRSLPTRGEACTGLFPKWRTVYQDPIEGGGVRSRPGLKAGAYIKTWPEGGRVHQDLVWGERVRQRPFLKEEYNKVLS